MTHGRIIGGVICTPDLEGSLQDYRDGLGLELLERGEVGDDLAASWGAEGEAGAAFATLRPRSEADCFVRLVEAPFTPEFEPMRSYGWAAYEISVQDVFALADAVETTGFKLVGPPRELPELPFFVPMQVTGRGREMLYLNEVRMDTPDSDLPKAQSPTDKIFIVILATPDREASARWYEEALKLEIAASYTLVYELINEAFALPADHASTITLIQKGRMPIVEIDEYPEGATERPGPRNRLPAGNALVTLEVGDLERIDVGFITQPVRRNGPLYRGRRSGTVRGPAGELIELVEGS